MLNRASRGVIAAAFLALVALLSFEAQAHEPFDSSSQAVVHPKEIELLVKMGVDGPVEFLKLAGYPQPAITQALRPRPFGSGYGLPVQFAARLFQVGDGTKDLPAKSLKVSSDGGEVLFTAIYPRPASSTLEFHALYFNGIEPMKHGSFVVSDESGHRFGSALLSRANTTLRVSLAVSNVEAEPPAVASTRTEEGDPPGPSTRAQVDQAPMAAGKPDPEQIAPSPSAPRPLFGEFLELGVEHILTGFDHLLFLVALLANVRRLRPMLAIITAFTLAHSVTLALAALDVVTLSSRVVEPVIAVSIVIVGLENLLRKDASAGRYWLAGGFGLIHGFGFAGALREAGLGLAGASIAMPLFSFNLGVELGQLAVASLVVPLLFWLRRRSAFGRYGEPVISAAVILVSGYWFVERAFWGT